MEQNTVINEDLTTAPSGTSTDRFFSEEQLQHDLDYYRAQNIAKSMLEDGFISLSQFNKLTELNRRSFSPFLSEIMPKSLDK